jgi:hypothetical protein
LLNQLKKKTAYSGEMTHHSQKRMKSAVENLFAIADEKTIYLPLRKTPMKFKINFITLTLPTTNHQCTDTEIHAQIFTTWLSYCKRRKGLKNYVWKCERQKNGNIHYHIITDIYIEKAWLSKSWNYHCQNLKLIDRFEEKHGHRNPPTTQIKAASNEEDVMIYLRKYLGKKITSDDGQMRLDADEIRLKGVKCWDASVNLKQKQKATIEITKDIDNHLYFLEWLKPHAVFKSDYFKVYKIDKYTKRYLLNDETIQCYEDWKLTIKHYTPKPSHTHTHTHTLELHTHAHLQTQLQLSKQITTEMPNKMKLTHTRKKRLHTHTPLQLPFDKYLKLPRLHNALLFGYGELITRMSDS